MHATADADAAAAAAPLASSSGPYEGDVYARNGEEGENGPTTLSVTHVREGVTDPSEEQPESDGAVQPARAHRVLRVSILETTFQKRKNTRWFASPLSCVREGD